MKSLVGLLITLLVSLSLFGQTNKVIDWTPYTKGDSFTDTSDAAKLKALEILQFTVAGKAVHPGQPFSAESDWLKTFAVRVKNVSGKRISSIRLGFGLPEAKNSEGISSGFSLEYGSALSTGVDYGTQLPIEPDEEIELIRNDRHYARDRDGIRTRTGLTEFSTVIIGGTTVRFVDGTIWSGYKLPLVPSKVAAN